MFVYLHSLIPNVLSNYFRAKGLQLPWNHGGLKMLIWRPRTILEKV